MEFPLLLQLEGGTRRPLDFFFAKVQVILVHRLRSISWFGNEGHQILMILRNIGDQSSGGHLGSVTKEKQVEMENCNKGFNLAPVQFCIIPDHVIS